MNKIILNTSALALALATTSLVPSDVRAGVPAPVVVRAKGSLAGNVGPIMHVYVNGVFIDARQVRNTTAYIDYVFDVSSRIQSYGARAKIDVFFSNDAVVGGQDRNLFVSEIRVATTKAVPAVAVYDRGDTYARAVDGVDTLPGQEALPWSGAMRFALSGLDGGPIPLAQAVAYPGKLTNLTTSGPVVVSNNGAIVKGLKIVNPNGPCILVRPGVKKVTIRDNEIGPCRDDGVRIGQGAGEVLVEHNYIHNTTNILPDARYQTTIDGNGIEASDVDGLTVRLNYIRDVTSGLAAFGGRNLVFHRNYVWDVHGDHTRNYVRRIGGQAVQFVELSSGAGSRVTCNVSEQTDKSAPEDHINVYKTSGTAQTPLLIAYNKLRGWGRYLNASGANGGILLGDGGGSYQRMFNNILVNAGGYGAQVAGGTFNAIEKNRILYENYQQFNVWAQGVKFSYWGNHCANNALLNNRIKVIDLVYPRPDGSIGGGQTYTIDSGCSATRIEGNRVEAESGLPSAAVLFAEEFAECAN